MEKLIADLPRDQLKKAAAFEEGEPVVIMGRANAAPVSPPSTAPAPSPQAQGPITQPETNPTVTTP